MKSLTSLFSSLTLLLISFFSFLSQLNAQSEAHIKFAKSQTNTAYLEQIVDSISNYNDTSTLQQWAQNKNFSLGYLDTLGNRAVLLARRANRPMYYQTFNKDAAVSVSADHLHPGGSLGLNLKGNGIEFGQWEPDWVYADHTEFNSQRVTIPDFSLADYDQYDYEKTRLGGHPTHVAGTMIARGAASSAKGMSFSGKIRSYSTKDWQAEVATEAANGLLIANFSWGQVRGWSIGADPYSGAAVNFWHGNPNISEWEDYLFGFYSDESQFLDDVSYSAPYFLLVQSAGNDRNDSYFDVGTSWKDDPGAECPHYYWDSLKTNPFDGSSGFWERADTCRSPDGPQDCIPEFGVAKNILTVGAVEKLSLPYSQPSDVVITSFSGFGSTDDGRIKPDIVAPGRNLYSSGWKEQDHVTPQQDYLNLSGTSMAAPTVAGTIGLLQQRYEQLYGRYMKSSTAKALVIQTAHEAGSFDGPDFKFGWGLLNADRAARTIAKCKKLHEMTLDENDTLLFELTYDSQEGFIKVTIAWTDPAGTPVAHSLDPSDRMLINDLDIRAIHDGTGDVFYPWVVDTTNSNWGIPKNDTTDNIVDNVEQVFIDAPSSGTYMIRVSHKDSLIGNIQHFAIVSNHELTKLNEQTPIADAGTDRTCPGIIGPDTIDSKYLYSWSPAEGLYYEDNVNTANPFANPISPTDYVLYMKDKCGDTLATDTVHVDVEYDVDSIIITQDSTWYASDSKSMIYLQIDSGATLTINDAIIKFGPDPFLHTYTDSIQTGIRINPYGRLVLDSATLTATNGCAAMWGGVRVWGDPDTNTYSLLDPNNPNGAILMKNNSVIEHAHIAVAGPPIPYRTGMIRAIDSKFKNNRMSLFGYGKNNTNWSIEDCAFLNDSVMRDTFNYPGEGNRAFVFLIAGSGYNFSGKNIFKSTLTLPDTSRGTGIFSWEGRFKLFGNDSSLFQGLTYGIDASSYVLGRAFIDRYQFKENKKGIYLKNMWHSTITRNTFNDNSEYGAYLYNCNAYMIEENTFESLNGNDISGIWIHNDVFHETITNRLYKNNFKSNVLASVLMRYNTGYASQYGLKVKCNDYEDNKRDVFVGMPPGISTLQGGNITHSSPAGNTFDGCSLTNGEITQLGGVLPIDYYHHVTTNTIPDSGCYDTLLTSLTPTVFSYSVNNSCPSNFPPGIGGGINGGGLEGRYNNETDILDSLELNEDSSSVAWQDTKATIYILNQHLVTYYLDNPTDSGANEKIEDYLLEDDRQEAKYSLFHYYLRQGRFTDADSLADTLCSSIHQMECDWLNLIIDKCEDGTHFPNELTKDWHAMAQLDDMAFNGDTLYGTMHARVLREMIHGERIHEVYADTSTSSAKRHSEPFESLNENPNITLYPNPNGGLLYVSINGENELPTKFFLYDISGRIIFSSTLRNQGITTLDLSALANGLYLYRISNVSNVMETGKLVIEH